MKTALLLLLSVLTAGAATLNVPGGYATIQAAVNAARAGDAISLIPGTYTENVTWKTAQAGPVTLECNGATLAGRLTLYKPQWTIRNLAVAGWKQDGPWRGLVELFPGSHKTRLEGLKIDGAGTVTTYGIAWKSDGASRVPFPPEIASDCVVTGCEILNIKGYPGVSMMGARNVLEGCSLHDFMQGDFLQLWGEGNVIRDNTFDGNRLAPSGEIGFHADFIQTFGHTGHGSRNHVIERNSIRNNEGQICQLEENGMAGVGAMGGWTFRNNVFVDNRMAASVTQAGVKWYNNTFVRCAPGHVLNLGEGNRGSSDGQEIYNNAFIDCGTAVNNEQGWYGDGTRPPSVQFYADYNFVVKNGKPMRSGDGPDPRFRFNEPHGVNGGDPKLDENFRPLEGSALIGKGRDGADIGAFSFARAQEVTVEVSVDGGKTWGPHHSFNAPAGQIFRIKP